MSLEHGRPTDDEGHAGDRLLPWPEVAKIIPYSRMHVGRLEKAGLFPARVQVGPNRVAWWESSILRFAKARPRGFLPIGPREAS
jgi:prophage regulatory protein